MRNRQTLGLAVVALVLAGGLASADEIRVLQPNGGAFDAGARVLIRWDYTFLESMPQTTAEKAMRIELMHFTETGGSGHGGGTAWTLDRTIGEVDVLATKHYWTVPSGVGGPNRVIRITMVQRPALTSTSAPFTITALHVVRTRVPLAMSIQVTSPEAGRTYFIGDHVPIVWSKALVPNDGNVWLYVCWPDRTTCGGGYPVANTDAANTGGANCGSYDWTISEPEAHDLVIRVEAHDDLPIGYSGVFHVKKKIRMPRGVLVGPLKKP